MILDYVDTSLVFSPAENKQWSTMTSDELKEKYVNNTVYTSFDLGDGNTIYLIADINNIAYQIKTDEITRNNLAVTIDDSSLNSIAVFLEPEESATVDLTVSTILSSENESDDMVYENIAEIIKFTTLTGRRTVSTQTVGNAKVSKAGYIGEDSTLGEPDTSIVEKVMLTPPTGADWIDTYVLTRVIIYVVGTIGVIVLGILFIPKLVDKIKNRKFIK